MDELRLVFEWTSEDLLDGKAIRMATAVLIVPFPPHDTPRQGVWSGTIVSGTFAEITGTPPTVLWDRSYHENRRHRRNWVEMFRSLADMIPTRTKRLNVAASYWSPLFDDEVRTWIEMTCPGLAELTAKPRPVPSLFDHIEL